MCDHEFYDEPEVYVFGCKCKKCGKGSDVVALEAKLDAAETALAAERKGREQAERKLKMLADDFRELSEYNRSLKLSVSMFNDLPEDYVYDPTEGHDQVKTLSYGRCVRIASEWIQNLVLAKDKAEAQCAAMRLRFEKYVRENCKLIRHNVADGIGKPDNVEGKCGGYAQNGDEPHYICQECVAAYDSEAEYNEKIIDAGSALLAELQRYRDAASSSAQRGTAGEDAP